MYEKDDIFAPVFAWNIAGLNGDAAASLLRPEFDCLIIRWSVGAIRLMDFPSGDGRIKDA